MFRIGISEVEEVQMKIFLTKENVKRILCDHFHIPYVEATRRESNTSIIIAKGHEVYWEGNPAPKRKVPAAKPARWEKQR